MSFLNLVVDLCAERIREQLRKPSREVLTAAAGPALANAALLMAQGCPIRYAKALRGLYSVNDLPCPNLDSMFDLELPTPSFVNTDAPSVSMQTRASTMSASVQAKVMTTSVSVQTEPMDTDHLSDVTEYRETQQLDDILRAVQTEPIDTKHLNEVREYRETQQLDDILRAVDEIPASMHEIEELLKGIKTYKELPSTYKKVEDLNYDDDSLYIGLEGHPINFNGDFYALNVPDNLDLEGGYTSPSSYWEDSFDENLGVHSITAPLTSIDSCTSTRSTTCLALTAPCINFTTPRKNNKFKTVTTPKLPFKPQRRCNFRKPPNTNSTVDSSNTDGYNNGTSCVSSSQIFRLNPYGKRATVCPGTPLTSTHKASHARSRALGQTLNYLRQFSIGTSSQSLGTIQIYLVDPPPIVRPITSRSTEISHKSSTSR